MNDIFLSNKYYFSYIKMSKYHYTDNRSVPHSHYIARLLKGRAKLVSKDNVVELSEGDVFYIPMDLSYESFWYGDTIEWKSYGFTYFPEGEYKRFKMQKIPCGEQLKNQVSNIPITTDIDSCILGDFYTVLSKLIPLMELDSRCRKAVIVETAIKKMNDNPDWDIPQIAEYCCVSDSTLYTAFKKVSGKTPNQLKNEILTEKAVRLLNSTDKSVQEISDSLGFSSTSYFRKILYRNTGKTPREIRKMSTSM